MWSQASGRTLAILVVVGIAIAAALAYLANNHTVAANFAFAALIGLLVGATELMARYRDSPFGPLLSVPGIFYAVINAGAASLAYFLITKTSLLADNEPLRVLTAGLAAMAFFRSGLFNVRIGESDVAVGPNLVLQIMLQALDRTYDRDRATPRSIAVTRIMGGISFAKAETALPSLCFNLMQNASDEEMEAISAEVKELAGSTMSDEAKALILGLALFNVVGEQTLAAAVNALGTTVTGFKTIDSAILHELAKVEPALVIEALPHICNELAHPSSYLRNASEVEALVSNIKAQKITDESKCVLIVYKLVRHYGESTVSIALSTMQPA